MNLPASWQALVLLALLVVVVAWYLTFVATRLDRLHARIEGAHSALDAQLMRRASVALQIALTGRLDPATGLLLADAAHAARETGDAGDAERQQAESDLSRALQVAFDEDESVAAFTPDATGRELLHELSSACLRVQLSRRFLNDVVRGARTVRRKKAVRYLRLAGHAGWPATAEFDDTPPPSLTGAVAR